MTSFARTTCRNVDNRRKIKSGIRGIRGSSFLIAGAASLFLLPASPVGAEIIDSIWATVGNEVILRSDILREIAPQLNALRAEVFSEDEFKHRAEQRMEQALTQAIENKILLREALLAGLEITEDQVEERIDIIRDRYETNKAFLQELQGAGETMSDFRERVRKQILAISMGMRKRRQFEEQAVVSESQVAQYYEDHKEEFAHPERVLLFRIFLAADEDTNERAKARARLSTLIDELSSGADFAALAKAYSEGPEAENGGRVGWITRGDLVKELDRVAFELAPGEVSGIVETEYGLHLLMVKDKQGGGVPSLDKARIEIEPILRKQEAQQRYEEWISELRKRSRVRVFI